MPGKRTRPQRHSSHGWRLKEALAKAWRHYAWWELACIGIGLFSFIGIVVLLFLPVGKGPSLYRPSDRVPPAGSAPFLAALSDSMAIPVDHGPPVEILVNGDEFLKSLLADIDSAQRSIDFMVYIWRDGALSDQVLAHLEQKQRAGVPVRVMYDAYGGLKAPSGKFDRLKSLGAQVTVFHSLIPLPWTISRAPKRNHRRAIIIDGTTAYTGGWAVDDVWRGDARNPSEWHDLMFRLRGSMAARLQGSFAEIWGATTGEILVGERFFPSAAPGGNTTYVTLSSSPSPDLFEGESFFLWSLLGATREIKIETPYFLPDASIRKVLMDKARAGVAVTILVPNEKTDEKSVRWAGQRIYQELMEAGVHIYEYQPTFTHTKLLVEDGLWAVIGSANLDNRSRKINDEVVLGLSDPDFAKSLDAVFAADLSRAKAIDLKQWRSRGLLQRVLELVSQTFVQQY